MFFPEAYLFFVSRNTNQMMEARKRGREADELNARSGESNVPPSSEAAPLCGGLGFKRGV